MQNPPNLTWFRRNLGSIYPSRNSPQNFDKKTSFGEFRGGRAEGENEGKAHGSSEGGWGGGKSRESQEGVMDCGRSIKGGRGGAAKPLRD